MIQLITYTGGDLATNGYLFPGTEGRWIAVDAPEGMAAEIERRGFRIEALLLTHGHFDHIWDAAAVKDGHHCPVYIHPADAGMLTDPGVFRMFGVFPDISAVPDPVELAVPRHGSLPFLCGGHSFTLLHIPGHSPGSVAFYEPASGLLLGGDVLFAGGIGRWDLPGGSHDELLKGIHAHLLTLPDPVKVLPGHGPATTIGIERGNNPYLREK